MRIIFGENKNLAKDAEMIIKYAFDKEQRVSADSEEVTLPEFSDNDDIMDVQMEKLYTMLGIRLEAGMLTMDNIDVDMFDQEDAVNAMNKSLCKSCLNKGDAETYFNEVISVANVKAKGIDLMANTKVWERVLPDGTKIYDLVTLNLDQDNKSMLIRMVKLYNRKNKLNDSKEKFFDPIMLSVSTYGGEIVRTTVGAAGEVLGNVAATVVNAAFEGGKQALYAASRDFKVGEIVTSKEAQSIVPNFKKQFNLAKENWRKNKGKGPTGGNLF